MGGDSLLLQRSPVGKEITQTKVRNIFPRKQMMQMNLIDTFSVAAPTLLLRIGPIYSNENSAAVEKTAFNINLEGNMAGMTCTAVPIG